AWQPSVILDTRGSLVEGSSLLAHFVRLSYSVLFLCHIICFVLIPLFYFVPYLPDLTLDLLSSRSPSHSPPSPSPLLATTQSSGASPAPPATNVLHCASLLAMKPLLTRF